MPAQATRITIGAGSPVVFRLETVRLASVSGIIRSSDKRQLSSGAVILRPLAAQGMTASPQDATLRPDGTFTFRDVPPGEYDLRARGEVDGTSPSLFAAFRLRVEGRDVEHVDMTLAPGARIEGRVVIDSPHPPRPSKVFGGLRVRAPFADGRPFGEALTGEVQGSGAYAIRGVMDGRHTITLDGLPDGWVLKRVTWRGRDITDDGLDLTDRRTVADVRVTITDVTTAIGGLVRDRSGAAIAEATVFIIPASPQFWTRASRRLRVLHPDTTGRYRVRGLPPGEYRAVAVADVDEDSIYDHDLLTALSAAGVAISLKELASITVDLSLTSPPGHPPSASR